MKADIGVMKSACEGLLQYIEKRNKDQDRKQLFDENAESAILKFSLVEMPPRAIHKPFRIQIPHPFHEASEVCVFVRDDKEDKPKKSFTKKKEKFGRTLSRSRTSSR